jgi:two-component sensor histidine kinase
VNAHAVTLHLDIDPISLDIDRATPCGLIINELVSNSLIYAFPNGKAGEIRIELHEDAHKQIALTVSDNGIGLPKELDFRDTESLGLQLVNTLADQIQGTITLVRNGGTKFIIVFRH